MCDYRTRIRGQATAELVQALSPVPSKSVVRWLGTRFGAIAAAQRGFSNGLACMARLTAWRFVSSRIAPPIWRSRGGTRILTPHYTYFTAVECFGYDAYGLRGLPRECQVRNFLDIGANIGAFTLAVLERWPEARGIACEPSAESYRALTDNLLRNSKTGCERLQAAVVGEGAPAKVSFRYKPASPSTSSILPANGNVQGEQVITVPTVSLTDLIRTLGGAVDLIKIDVEGAEYEMIERTPSDVLENVKLLVMEYHAVRGRSREELVARVERAGLALCCHEYPLLWFGDWPMARAQVHRSSRN